MDSSSGITTLGMRLREARRARGLSQEALAKPEFTKSYVSAVERGKARPSLKALELMAGRLGIPPGELLAAPRPPIDEPDIPALDEDLAYQLDHLKMLLHRQQFTAARDLLASAEDDYVPYLGGMRLATRYRFHRIRALIYLHSNEPGPALADLATALDLAGQLGDPQEVERTRNVLGSAYYMQDYPQQALDLHTTCLHAIHTGVVKDLNLKLNIYSNLANDYWALGQFAQAARIYHEALQISADLDNPERQAAIQWGLSISYRSQGDLNRAKLYAARALALYDLAANRRESGQMHYNLAAILTERGEHAEAERHLDAARDLLDAREQPLLVSMLYQHYADLARSRQDLATAREYAQQSVALSQPLYDPVPGSPHPPPEHANAARTYCQALRMLGLLEEQLGQAAAADAAFVRALEVAHSTEYLESAASIHFDYAEVLAARGAHQQAAPHYQAAITSERRSWR